MWAQPRNTRSAIDHAPKMIIIVPYPRERIEHDLSFETEDASRTSTTRRPGAARTPAWLALPKNPFALSRRT